MKDDVRLIQQLLPLEENGWLDFKGKMYAVFDKEAKHYDWQKGEMVRDILALTNGNTQSAGKTAYLLIGAGDERRPDGSRQLSNIEAFTLSRRQLMDWVNAYAEPPVEELFP